LQQQEQGRGSGVRGHIGMRVIFVSRGTARSARRPGNPVVKSGGQPDGFADYASVTRRHGF